MTLRIPVHVLAITRQTRWFREVFGTMVPVRYTESLVRAKQVLVIGTPL